MKKVILLVLLAAAAFIATAGASMLLSKGKAARANHTEHAASAPAEASTLTAGLAGTDAKLSPKESQLDELIREIRFKLTECKQREQALDDRESRLQITQELIRKQTQDLENLRMSLLAPLNTLKEEQDKLEKSRVRVVQEEKANLKRLASAYDKMDPANGGKILAGLCENQKEDDAVKILYYMSERSAAKVLGELPDKNLAARLTEKLKRVREEG